MEDLEVVDVGCVKGVVAVASDLEVEDNGEDNEFLQNVPSEIIDVWSPTGSALKLIEDEHGDLSSCIIIHFISA